MDDSKENPHESLVSGSIHFVGPCGATFIFGRWDYYYYYYYVLYITIITYLYIYLFIFLRVFSLYPNDIIDISFTLLQASFNTFQDYVPPLSCDFDLLSTCSWSAFDERGRCFTW